MLLSIETKNVLIVVNFYTYIAESGISHDQQRQRFSVINILFIILMVEEDFNTEIKVIFQQLNSLQ